jgi:phosphate transporter
MAGQRKRGSIFGKLPSFPRRSSVTNDSADVIQSSLPAEVRSSSSRQRSRSLVVTGSSTEDELASSRDLGASNPQLSPRAKHRSRALSDLSSADDHFDRRGSMSSISSGGGLWRSTRRAHKLGLQPMDPSTYPEWLKDELAKGSDVESASTKHIHYSWKGNTDYATVLRIGMKKRITALWLDLYALKQYVDLNFTAFQKILKKYDKNTNSKLKKTYMDTVLATYPWTDEAKAELDLLLNQVLFLYRRVVVAGDEELAKEQLRAQLRERIVVDRETVWSQMVGDRRGQGIFRSVEPDAELPAFEQPKRGLRTPCGRIAVPKWLKKGGLIFILAVLSMVGIILVQPMDHVEESNCLALLVFCTILWATEAIPLFVTSLTVPFLVVVLGVLRNEKDDSRLPANDATKFIFSVMFSPTIMLLIGGFTIAAGLSRTRIDHMAASRILTSAGGNPSFVLLVLMFVATFASMWISNVAAPTLCYALVRPILDELPPKSVFSKCLIIAIALASNIGGMASPISSPQNLIALGSMVPELTWIEWFAISLPVGITSVVAIWAFLHYNYRWESDLRIPKMRKNTDSLTGKHYFVLFFTVFTIALWCIEKNIETTIGDMGIIAIIPLIAFFGTGILRKEDFHDFQWPIVFLAMGGIALGKAVLSSGLLESMDKFLVKLVDGMGLYSILVVFCSISLVVATFISHTIAAVLLVPIADRIGSSMADPHPRLLIMATALICSAGMGLPVSGFPNMTAYVARLTPLTAGSRRRTSSGTGSSTPTTSSRTASPPRFWRRLSSARSATPSCARLGELVSWFAANASL